MFYFLDFGHILSCLCEFAKGDLRMTHSLTFAVIGGDRRSFYAAKRLGEYGFETKLFGLENEEAYNPSEKIQTDTVLLPVPFTRDGIHIFAPESAESILISDVLASISENSLIFAGNVNGITDERILDYAKRETFAVRNAVPTAEGALLLALRNGKRTLFGMRVAVIGYGKVAFATAKLFHAVGAEITVFARKAQARAEAHMMGYTARPLTELSACAGEYELLINTVPARILNREILSKISKDTWIMELASAPFGLDFDEAKSLGVHAELASGLPGKFFPETAGYAVADTVLELLREKEIIF